MNFILEESELEDRKTWSEKERSAILQEQKSEIRETICIFLSVEVKGLLGKNLSDVVACNPNYLLDKTSSAPFLTWTSATSSIANTIVSCSHLQPPFLFGTNLSLYGRHSVLSYCLLSITWGFLNSILLAEWTNDTASMIIRKPWPEITRRVRQAISIPYCAHMTATL